MQHPFLRLLDIGIDVVGIAYKAVEQNLLVKLAVVFRIVLSSVNELRPLNWRSVLVGEYGHCREPIIGLECYRTQLT